MNTAKARSPHLTAIATHPAYARMVTESRVNALPLRFQTDLTTWDAQALSRAEVSAPFGWILYSDGTHMLTGIASAEECVRHFRDMAYSAHFYVWDGRTLTEVARSDFAPVLSQLFRR